MSKTCTFVCSQLAHQKLLHCVQKKKLLQCFPTYLGKPCVKHFASDPYEKDPWFPIKRVYKMLKNDMKVVVDVLDQAEFKPPFIMPGHCDVLIVGGGIIGSSIAYWLKRRALSGLSVIVLEKDTSVIQKSKYFKNSTEFANCSTALSAGGLRQQFSLKENIEMSLFGAEFLRNIDDYLGIEGEEPPNVNFTPQGYLFLSTDKSAHILKENAELQRSLGAKVELLSKRELQFRFPWMNFDDIELGCHGLENEGWLDPWSLLMAFKKKAMSLGVDYINGEVTGFEFRDMPKTLIDGVPLGEYKGVNGVNVKLPDGDVKTIEFSQLVIAAGSDSGKVGAMLKMGTGPGYLQVPIPVEPRKRYVYCFHCPEGPGMKAPFVIDPSGMYFRKRYVYCFHCPEGPGMKAPFVIDPSGMYFRREGFGGNYICGRSPNPSEEPSCDNLDVDHQFFEESVWPVLAHRVPAFEKLKMKSSWAGFYDFNSFDENAFIGPHPGYMNVLLATGFSGHGLQQAPAVGRAIMELIVDGAYASIDLSRMQFERVIHEEYLYESNII